MSTVIQRAGKSHTIADMERLEAQGLRYELVKGELQEMSPSGPTHGNATSRASYYVNEFVYKNDLGETFVAEAGFVLSRDPDTVLAPDFAFIRTNRLPSVFAETYCDIMPDLVIETRSPGDSKREIMAKTELWLSAGVLLVWNIDPKAQAVTVHQAGREPQIVGIDDVLGGADVLPGFTLPVRNLFRETGSSYLQPEPPAPDPTAG